jgi:hypothetical protein
MITTSYQVDMDRGASQTAPIGRTNLQRAAFALHHVGHANARSNYGYPVEPTGAELIRNEAKGRKA